LDEEKLGLARTSAHLEVLLSEEKEGSAAVARLCARILDRNKMENVKVVDVCGALQVTDYFVLASGRNPRQLKSSSDEILKEMRELGRRRQGLEGYRDAKWVLIDLSDVVVHLFLNESREFYGLDELWGDCPTLDWVEKPGSAAVQPAEVHSPRTAGRG
jgi:ribosome-associated protein